MSSETAWAFNHKELSHYYAFFHEIVPEGQALSGSRAREFFLLSNLSQSTLSHIWEMSDYDKDGQLNEAEFSIAVNFCQLALDGVSPPPSLPSALQKVIEQATHPENHLAPMKYNQLEKCMSVFMSFVENDSGTGYLAGEAARYLLTNSQLPKAVLFHTWHLSDADKDGRLSFKEFVVAMHLVYITKLNQPLPIRLNPDTILPQEFASMAKKVAIMVEKKPLCGNKKGMYPLVPAFVMPINNPCISPVFKEVPADKFLNGKFENFTGNPFSKQQPQTNGSVHNTSSKSQEELSNSSHCSSSVSSYTDSGEVSKPPSSHHSSIRSLVEEKDKPHLHQVEPVAVSNDSDDEDVELDPEEKRKMEAELEAISKASETYLKKNGGTVKPAQSPPPAGSEKFAKDTVIQSASVKGLDNVITEISDKPSENDKEAQLQTPKPATTEVPKESESIKKSPEPAKVIEDKAKTPPSTSGVKDSSKKPDEVFGIDLSFLDDIEAQVLDVLDDTNSFDPLKAPPPEPKPEKKPEVKKSPSPVVSKKGTEETDSVFVPMSPSKSKTLPHKRTTNNTNGDFSPFEIRTRKTSDSSMDTPSPRRNTVGMSPIRKKLGKETNRASVILDDLDNIFSDELAQIDGFMDERKTREEEKRKRAEKDMKELESRVLEVSKKTSTKIATMEEVAQRRDRESMHKLKEWEKEFEEKSKIAYENQTNKTSFLNDETIDELESQFRDLIEHEASMIKETEAMREERLKQWKKEEEERKQRMKEARKEVTIEEWIQMMEEKKVKEMTPEEQEKYKERKQQWLEHRRQQEEEKKRRDEERMRKNREMMEQEYLRQRMIEAEMEKTRLTKAELALIEQEQFKKEAEERKMRSEMARIKKEEDKQREIENNKPKARSGIAARWESQVKGRSDNDFSSTVISQQKSASYREQERLAKRVGKLS